MPSLSTRFTVCAVARRGRGETDFTEFHSLEDEIHDLAEILRGAAEPVFLLGHSYGAHVALGAASVSSGRVRKLVLYEPPWPGIFGFDVPPLLAKFAHVGDWDRFVFHFFHDFLSVPAEDLNALRSTDVWPPILADAKASLGDLRALTDYNFRPERFANLTVPVLLQIGSESPRHLYATDTLAGVLPDARIVSLQGQAHEGMTTSPGLYVETVLDFLLGSVRPTSQPVTTAAQAAD
jgi:pimeloyl-ACP methyl ester carboxylesterase